MGTNNNGVDQEFLARLCQVNWPVGTVYFLTNLLRNGGELTLRVAAIEKSQPLESFLAQGLARWAIVPEDAHFGTVTLTEEAPAKLAALEFLIIQLKGG